MRLWPTTPLLVRETVGDVTLAGQQLDSGTQVMIVNTFNHRDPDSVEDADRLCPHRWSGNATGGSSDFRFNHLSNGSQDCPGGPLVRLLGKAVLAQLLDGYALTLLGSTLDPEKPLPHMLDSASIRFGAGRRSKLL
jgi:cytochrome P450